MFQSSVFSIGSDRPGNLNPESGSQTLNIPQKVIDDKYKRIDHGKSVSSKSLDTIFFRFEIGLVDACTDKNDDTI